MAMNGECEYCYTYITYNVKEAHCIKTTSNILEYRFESIMLYINI